MQVPPIEGHPATAANVSTEPPPAALPAMPELPYCEPGPQTGSLWSLAALALTGTLVSWVLVAIWHSGEASSASWLSASCWLVGTEDARCKQHCVGLPRIDLYILQHCCSTLAAHECSFM